MSLFNLIGKVAVAYVVYRWWSNRQAKQQEPCEYPCCQGKQKGPCRSRHPHKRPGQEQGQEQGRCIRLAADGKWSEQDWDNCLSHIRAKASEAIPPFVDWVEQNIKPAVVSSEQSIQQNSSEFQAISLPDRLTLIVEAPGFLREDIDITLTDDTRVLSVKGQAQSRVVSDKRLDLQYTLPQNSDIQRMTANLDHGLLLIDIPTFAPPTVSTTTIPVSESKAGNLYPTLPEL
ncbi:uncharacterized protein BJ171DRAFT_566884 [Polychytrium aggregatum]|uniref:uncharacterized protein n=1 Tax=Polychytrium aggregatum TaxID=110093 RepID=UPI0022FF1DFC|nr:uncharacterized protein BJ171DRAFT_566884 [Polychytrium aggregatum]KAI9206031.1 hypothetical protein BJ171DRAFT_566884 [Polychytrium aggregatum]